MFSLRVNATLKLLRSSLILNGGVTGLRSLLTGIYHTSVNDVNVNVNATYYLKRFNFGASFNSPTKILDLYSSEILKGRPNYSISAGWGNGFWAARLVFSNFACWDYKHGASMILTTPYYEKRTESRFINSHAAMTLNVTYTFNYGKKIRHTNESIEAGSAKTTEE